MGLCFQRFGGYLAGDWTPEFTYAKLLKFKISALSLIKGKDTVQ